MGDDHHDLINSGSWWKSSSSSSTSSSMRETSIGSSVFHDKLHQDHHHHLHMIGLGLSSQSQVDQWNQPLLRGDSKAETSFGMMLQENLNLDAASNANAIQESLWRDQQINNNNSDFKPQIMTTSNRGFYLDNEFSPHVSSSTDHNSTVTCQGFHLPPSADQRYGSSTGKYDHMAAAAALPSATWLPTKPHSPLRFSNNATFWNPAVTSEITDPPQHDPSARFFPALHPPQNFDEQPKSISVIRDSSGGDVKRGGGDQPAAKRAKSEASSPSPALKVRKEKMGDRIAALQQLVSPFGKTDAASVLSETIEYIKFLHQQVSALSNPYMKSEASLQHQQSDHCKEVEAQEEADLRSRGLCVVPVSSTFPVTHDTTVDFWTPTFGGTFR